MKKVKLVSKKIQNDLWDTLSEEQKASVFRAKNQLENGEGVSHKDAMKKYRKLR